MNYVSSGSCYIAYVMNAPAFIAPGDSVSFTVTVKMHSQPQDTVSAPLTVGLCRDDGSDFRPLFRYGEKALRSGSSVAIRVNAVVNEVPFYEEGAGSYAICVTGAGRNGRVYAPYAAGCGTALDMRRPPSVTCGFTDTKGFDAICGRFIPGESDLVFSCVTRADTRDPANAVTERVLEINGGAVKLSEGDNSIGTLAPDAPVPWRLTVRDIMGGVYTEEGVLAFEPYTRPRITALSLERYSAGYDETGAPVYEKDDTSSSVRLSVSFSVDGMGGLNSFTLTAAWEGGERTVLSGGGGEFTISQDREAIDAAFSPAREWPVTFTLSDRVHPVSAQYRLPKAGAVFSIEPGGVAVGMRSGGKRGSPAFEVAYPARFYGGAYDGEGTEICAERYTSETRRIGSFMGRPLYRMLISLDSVARSSSAAASAVDMGVVPHDIVNISGFVFTDGVGDIALNSYGSSERMAFASPVRENGSLTGVIKCWTGAANHGARIFVEYTPEEVE